LGVVKEGKQNRVFLNLFSSTGQIILWSVNGLGNEQTEGNKSRLRVGIKNSKLARYLGGCPPRNYKKRKGVLPSNINSSLGCQVFCCFFKPVAVLGFFYASSKKFKEFVCFCKSVCGNHVLLWVGKIIFELTEKSI